MIRYERGKCLVSSVMSEALRMLMSQAISYGLFGYNVLL